MILSLTVDNFKALDNVNISFTPFSVLIGNNAAGKTTVLQAIDFLKYCCTSHIEKFLSDRGLSVSELCSKYNNRKQVLFSAKLRLDGKDIRWDLIFSADKVQNNLYLLAERIILDNKTILQFDRRIRLSKKPLTLPHNYRWNVQTDSTEPIMSGTFDNSMIRFVDVEKESQQYPALAAIKKFFQSLEVLDLLSPTSMRGSSQGQANTLGFSGEKLGSFVKGLSPAERDALIADVREFAKPLTAVVPKTKQYGWVHLEAKEQYGDKTISLGSESISGGVLRIIAFCCLRYLKNEGGAILLDEIEDGINNESLERLIQLFMRIQQERGVQIIATTHSTVLLDYVADANSQTEADAASIVFLNRDAHGRIIARDMLASPAIQEKLGYMYPGEIVLNMTNDELSNALSQDVPEEE